MILYLDTSSLIKLYVEEEGSSHVRQLVDAAAVVTTSVVAYPEARAALARHRRDRAITPSEFDRSKGDFERDWPSLLRIDLTEPLYRQAGDLAERHSLRGFDSLHLASFLTLDTLRASGEAVIFSSFDEHLNRAARLET